MVNFRVENPIRFGTDLWDPSHRFETSWLLPPYALATVRAAFGCYGLFVLLFQSGYYCTHPSEGGCTAAGDEYSYFTVLTYWGLACYNLTAALHTFSYARTGTPLLDRLPRPLQALHAFYYTTVTVYPFIVTAVYWGLIYPGVWFTVTYDAWSNTSEHALNSVFAFFEIVVPRTPAPLWIHAWWIVFVLALYLTLAYVTYYTKGFYTYTFLDIQTQGSAITAGYILGIAVGAVIVFSIVKGVIHLRLWATERKGGFEGKFADKPLGGSRGSGEAGGLEDVEMGRVEKLGSSGGDGSPVSGSDPRRS
ncbi:hypothetical protein N0V93_003079 [Gnomoniopsis smithogilvyi]|uniref:FAR-17a/AIG1-like protein n=1 Tax=Gnomoniopsis smithogilvyi TaxID=1191159 RepID=A0A9W8YXW0_9PEZI|nr:hypothetical protein N0V93_003079 [Gnomoniopsis smithogilvyi]